MLAYSTFMVAVAIFFCQHPNILCIFDKLPVENYVLCESGALEKKESSEKSCVCFQIVLLFYCER